MNGRGILVVLVAGAAIASSYWYFLVRTPEEDPATNAAGTAKAPAVDYTKVPASFPLRKGSKGKEVAQLQRYLKVSADGIWGDQTQKAFVAAKLMEAPKLVPETEKVTKTLYLQYGLAKY